MSTHGGGGRHRASGETYTGFQPSARAALSRVEPELAALGHERIYVFDARDGRQLGPAVNGQTGEVGFPSTAYSNPNAVTVHNHPPPEDGPSAGDLWNFARHGNAGMVVIGQGYRYVLQPPSGGWPAENADRRALADSIRDTIVPIAQRQATDSLSREVFAGRMTEEQAQREYWHRITESVARSVGMRYYRQTR